MRSLDAISSVVDFLDDGPFRGSAMRRLSNGQLDARQELRCRQPLEEPRERCLVGDVWPVKAARLGYPGVVLQRTDQRPCRRKAHVVFSNEGSPDGFDGVSLGAAPRRAYQFSDKARIVEAVKEPLKLSNDGRGLSDRCGSGIICGDHGKSTLPIGLGAVRCCSTSRPRSSSTPMLCDKRPLVNRQLRKNTTN
jgi:hypothetical protein